MIFSPRTRMPLVRGGSPGEQALRFLLLIGVFGLVAWLFWQHTGSSIDEIQSRGTVWDQTGLLDSDSRDLVRQFGNHFRDQFGIVLKVRVTNSPDDEEEDTDPKTLRLSVYPEREQVRILAPSYLALDPAMLRYLENEFFAYYFERGEVGEGIVQALVQIVTALEGGGQSEDEPAS